MAPKIIDDKKNLLDPPLDPPSVHPLSAKTMDTIDTMDTVADANSITSVVWNEKNNHCNESDAFYTADAGDDDDYDSDDDEEAQQDERPAHRQRFMCCWTAMDNNGFVFTIFSVLILSIGGLAQWSFLIMVRKCFWEVGPRAIDFMSLPVFLAIVGLIIAVANPMLNACLGSVPVPAANSRNPDQPSCSSDYSQDQRDKQLVIFILATVSIIWTAFCILYASDVVQSECTDPPTQAPTPTQASF